MATSRAHLTDLPPGFMITRVLQLMFTLIVLSLTIFISVEDIGRVGSLGQHSVITVVSLNPILHIYNAFPNNRPGNIDSHCSHLDHPRNLQNAASLQLLGSLGHGTTLFGALGFRLCILYGYRVQRDWPVPHEIRPLYGHVGAILLGPPERISLPRRRQLQIRRYRLCRRSGSAVDRVHDCRERVHCAPQACRRAL
jgi:hypothetical protein